MVQELSRVEHLTRYDTAPTEAVALPPEGAAALLASGHYRSGIGWPWTAWHYRRLLPGDGSGLHLVINPATGTATLHWDQHHPAVRLIAHLFVDAPSQTLFVGALACACIAVYQR